MSAHITKLDAVNSILAVIGEMPVTTLEGTLNADAVLASRMLEDVVRDVLVEGWYFNTDHNMELTPDVNGNIELADTVINVDVDPRYSIDVDVVQRGNRLYDKKNHTYTFTKPLKGVSMTLFLEFDELPASVKQYVLGLAKVKFQSNVLGDSALHQMLLQDLQKARTAFVAEDIRQSDRNLLDTYPNSRMGYNSFHRVVGGR